MEMLGARIKLNPRPARQFAAALEVAMLGHCPGLVRIERLLALTDAVSEIKSLGFTARVNELINELAKDTENQALTHLPIPIRSLAEFEDIFPQARTLSTEYQSKLAGDKAWLPLAVDDFFANGGEKCWIIQIPESEGLNGFLPQFNSPLYDTENLKGLASALILSGVGLVAMPDLERIQIAANLSDIPHLRLANPDPAFIPCSNSIDDGHRERRDPSGLEDLPEPSPFVQLLQQILAFTSRHRSDIQCLFSMPLAYSETLDSPSIDSATVAEINNVRQTPSAYLLRQVQLLYPYLRNENLGLHSAVGVLAGAIANSARARGIWRSVAGLSLTTSANLFPPISTLQTVALRESPGIAILNHRDGTLVLDDERLSVPALHRNDYLVGSVNERTNGLRSSEVVRFMGYLVRQLSALGERIIFNLSYEDPRPRLILEKFFNGLFRAGALRGNLPEDAFTIRQYSPREAVIGFDIEVAPAFPIDKIILTFVNRDGIWISSEKTAGGSNG